MSRREDQATETVGTKSMDALVAEWRDWQAPPIAKPDVIPPGWICARQFAEIRGVIQQSAKAALEKGVRAGNLERRLFRVIMPNGRPFRVAYFRQRKPAR